MLCTAEHCSLRSRKPKLYGDIKSRYPKITAAMEKLLYFWVDKSHKRATNSTGIRANWINCLLYIKKVLLNLHNFPLLNINCTEPYLGPLYISYIMVQILNCKIPERVLLNGAIWKRFSKVSRRWRWAACHGSCKFLLISHNNPPGIWPSHVLGEGGLRVFFSIFVAVILSCGIAVLQNQAVCSI